MEMNTIKQMISFRRILILAFLLQSSIFTLQSSVCQAQITNVHGTVSDDMGGLPGASVCEIDGTGRIIEATVTDINGNFSMRIRNQDDKLRFSFVGCKTQTLPINRETYHVKLVSQTTIETVTVTASEKVQGDL